MKKYLLVILAMLMFIFVLAGISQAGQCVYYGHVEDSYFYYDSSSVRYSGSIVSFETYDNPTCEESITTDVSEIDCARILVRHQDLDGTWGSWKPFRPGYPTDTARIKLCR
jgi:hypothetical protein